jgi:hypothetical protein
MMIYRHKANVGADAPGEIRLADGDAGVTLLLRAFDDHSIPHTIVTVRLPASEARELAARLVMHADRAVSQARAGQENG